MKNYYLGLDMGTNSVGWAVTDTEYRLIRKKGKDMWGIREFEEAKTSAERRAKRGVRRNHARSKVRIGYLRDYFHDEIAKVDPDFFTRLQNSKYYPEDKDSLVSGRNGIFNDADYSDADYYKQYPTIFHLRKELLESAEHHDVRLVYLALENMFKHRGHFLSASISTDDSEGNMGEAYTALAQCIEETLEISLPTVEEREFADILGSRDLSRTRKTEEVMILWGADKKEKKMNLIAKAVCGLKVDATSLFDMETEEKIEFSFSDSAFEDKETELFAAVGDSYANVIENLKVVYSLGCLVGILRDSDYLSQTRVKDYEKHRKDLKILKSVVRKYCDVDSYNAMFREAEDGSYSAYVGTVNAGKKQRRNMGGRKREDFYKTIKKMIKEMPSEDPQVAYIKDEVDKETFLPKQLTSDNGIIPNQVHAKEMKKILENAENYLPFLKDCDEGGRTVTERILALFTFQVPYYVGPTTGNSAKMGGNGWVVRKEEGAVLPWNIEEKIDLKATSEEFVKRLIRKCTYLYDESVLPKSALEYEAFSVLNVINNIKINEEKISVELKQNIYRDLFESGKKVTRKKIETYLTGKGVLENTAQLTGFDKEISIALASYGKFYGIFGEAMKTDATRKMVENIIFWCTVYGDSKKFLKEQLKEHYPELTDDVVKRIVGFKLKDWGRMSKEFLELKACRKDTGEEISLIRALWETNYNMMELLHSEHFTFGEALEDKRTRQEMTLTELSADMLDEYYFSAPVKRMVWQTLKLIREITELMGNEPDRVFIEMTRSDEEKGDRGRKSSRAKQLLELYKNIKEESHEWAKEIENADASGKLRSKKMYLYFTQMGRCMYTGESIDLDDLFNDNLYDIDHIYPRHFVKDDNMANNLVLVSKKKNANKSDTYPLAGEIRHNPKVKELWDFLREKGLISAEKYRRLTGSREFTEEQKADFIARQLVETSQGTKGVADLLKQVLPDTKIVYAKASNVSDFRRDRKMLKSRIVNDMHHAKDAYLNIVVGNVYYVKFTQNPVNFIKKDYAMNPEKYRYNLSKMFDWDVVRGDDCAWVASKDGTSGTIVTVREMMEKNTPLLTRMNFEGHGAIANETLYGKEKAKGEGYIPFKETDAKMSDVTKYGGFSSASTAYFFLVEHEKKGKKARTLETMPIYLAERMEGHPERLKEYCENTLGLEKPSIRISKIRLQSLIKLNGYYVHISGKTGKQIVLRNAVQLCLGADWVNYVKKVENVIDRGYVVEDISEEKNLELYDILVEKHRKGIYSRKPTPMGEKLQNGRGKLMDMDLLKQCQAIAQVIQLSAIGTGSADLTLLGGAEKSGILKIGKDISKNKEVKLVNQSITGIYEKEIDLLTV